MSTVHESTAKIDAEPMLPEQGLDLGKRLRLLDEKTNSPAAWQDDRAADAPATSPATMIVLSHALQRVPMIRPTV
jgi:hypothetical protein